MASILVIHGPNLNLLGRREPNVYGTITLNGVDRTLAGLADDHGHQLEAFQSNAEHELIERIHKALTDNVQFILINPAAFTHTSVAIRDALLAVSIPFIEVHLSNVYKREPFRQCSYFTDIAEGVICGLGTKSYEYALRFAFEKLKEQ
ncbi:MAG: type II 3-dehydroquinate dehydratase [Endozoicomonas sp. (ex Botrylloides leachii)]|nr:type II 3-dehydroquinate dehydratase [Endozoicomonas sp. (ex Botrylloides leachii)]